MSIPNYDNAVQWYEAIKRLPLWMKIASGAVFLLVAYIYFGTLRKENHELKIELSNTQEDIVELRDKKNELHRENLHLKELLDPIQKHAELLYPEMETASAIAKLAEDLKEVRALATKDEYRPLDQDLRKAMVEALRTLRAQDSVPTFSVTIKVQPGNTSRSKVADDLKSYLEEAGWRPEVISSTMFYKGPPPAISIKMHPDGRSSALQLANIIAGSLVNTKFVAFEAEDFPRAHLEIRISGDPLFLESGVVTFR